MGIVDTVMTKVGQTLLDLEGRFGDREAVAPQPKADDQMSTVVPALEALRQHQRDMTDAQAQMRNALVAEIQHLQKQVEELHEAAAMQSTLYIANENLAHINDAVWAIARKECGCKGIAISADPRTGIVLPEAK